MHIVHKTHPSHSFRFNCDEICNMELLTLLLFKKEGKHKGVEEEEFVKTTTYFVAYTIHIKARICQESYPISFFKCVKFCRRVE